MAVALVALVEVFEGGRFLITTLGATVITAATSGPYRATSDLCIFPCSAVVIVTMVAFSFRLLLPPFPLFLALLFFFDFRGGDLAEPRIGSLPTLKLPLDRFMSLITLYATGFKPVPTSLPPTLTLPGVTDGDDDEDGGIRAD